MSTRLARAARAHAPGPETERTEPYSLSLSESSCLTSRCAFSIAPAYKSNKRDRHQQPDRCGERGKKKKSRHAERQKGEKKKRKKTSSPGDGRQFAIQAPVRHREAFTHFRFGFFPFSPSPVSPAATVPSTYHLCFAARGTSRPAVLWSEREAGREGEGRRKGGVAAFVSPRRRC